MKKEGESIEKSSKIIGDNSSGVTSVVLGIVSIVLSTGNGIGIVLGIIGLFFGVNQKNKSNNKWATSGIVLNIIGIVLGVILLILLIMFIINNNELLSQIQSQIPYAK